MDVIPLWRHVRRDPARLTVIYCGAVILRSAALVMVLEQADDSPIRPDIDGVRGRYFG